MYLCPECFFLGVCRNLKARLVSDAELSSPTFVADLKAYADAYARQHDVPWRRWPDQLASLYCFYRGEIVDQAGRVIYLDTEVFDGEAVGYWFRQFCKPVANDVSLRIRCEARERVRVMATILRANDPAGSRLWGIRAANDEDAPVIASGKAIGGDRCAYSEAYAERTVIRYGSGQPSLPKAAYRPSPFDRDLDDDVPF